eukprot:1465828-Pleurochrysis_carterae.AAC.1
MPHLRQKRLHDVLQFLLVFLKPGNRKRLSALKGEVDAPTAAKVCSWSGSMSISSDSVARNASSQAFMVVLLRKTRRTGARVGAGTGAAAGGRSASSVRCRAGAW